ncbi:MAG: hypothetical protein ACXW4O_10935, partial [Candidatus Binatia bacterium]
MVTTKDMRIFARDCRRWGREISNPSDRQTFFLVAQTWDDTAVETDRILREGGKLECNDLRTKLN